MGKILQLGLIVISLTVLPVSFAWAEMAQPEDSTQAPKEAAAETGDQTASPGKAEPTTEPKTAEEWNAERAKAEAEKAKAEAEQAKIEAEMAKIKLEKEKQRLERNKKRAEQQEKEQDNSGYHRHDGFFLRMELGFGFSGYKVDGTISDIRPPQGLTDPSGSGPTMGGSISLGGCLEENLVFHMDLGGLGLLADFDTEASYTYAFGGIGFGLTYYLMPANIFVGGGVGYAHLSFNDRDVDEYSDEKYPNHTRTSANGPSFRFLVGKEWWVSDNWALGLALQAFYAYTKSREAEFHTSGGMMLFTATYN